MLTRGGEMLSVNVTGTGLQDKLYTAFCEKIIGILLQRDLQRHYELS